MRLERMTYCLKAVVLPTKLQMYLVPPTGLEPAQPQLANGF